MLLSVQLYGRIRDVLVTPEFVFLKINIIQIGNGLALCLIIGVSDCPKLHLLIKEPDETLCEYPKYPSHVVIV